MFNHNLPKIETKSNYGIFATAHVLLAHFTDLIVNDISICLRGMYGDNWLEMLKEERPDFNELNFRDPQAILKEIARNGASQLRFALNASLAQERRKNFYDGVDDLLGERNAWVHRQINETKEELQGLAVSADDLLDLLAKERVYSNWITEILYSAENSEGSKHEKNDDVNIDMEPSMDNTDQKEDMTLGQPVNSRFLSHTYLVGDNGSIINRTSGESLSDISPEYGSSLSVIIKNLRLGSRLRLTEEGQLCSFMDDHWGFLVQVNPTQWFPNHLKNAAS